VIDVLSNNKSAINSKFLIIVSSFLSQFCDDFVEAASIFLNKARVMVGQAQFMEKDLRSDLISGP